MSTEVAKKEPSAVDRLKHVLSAPSIEEQFKNALGEQMPLFIASLIDVYSTDGTLQRCNPNLVAREALKAATLKLPINKSLGLAYIIPYKDKSGELQPQFQVGYKGFVQLAVRSGQYRYINADVVLEGELRGTDKLTGELDLNGKATSDQMIGAFAYLETLNGFRKGLFWNTDRIHAHARRHSSAYKSGKNTPWQTDFEAMAIKTVLKSLLSKYGIMSVEMIGALSADEDDRTPEARLEDAAIKALQSGEFVDVQTGEIGGEPIPEEDLGPEF